MVAVDRPRPPDPTEGTAPCFRSSIERVTKRYRHEVVVDDLSFTVQPGRVTGFLGPNGAGKSTTMKILLDLAKCQPRPRHDRRHPLPRHPGPGTHGRCRSRAQRIPPGPQRPQPPPDPRGRRRHRPARIEEVLEMAGIAHAADRHVGAYSLGMRQRLGIAAALLGDPPVLVLDEPGNGLDPQGIRWLRDLLRARAAAGGTVFVSSHLLSEVEHLADEVVVISHGRLVAQGALSTLRKAGVSVHTPVPERLTQS